MSSLRCAGGKELLPPDPRGAEGAGHFLLEWRDSVRSALGGACSWQHSSVNGEVSSPGMEMFVLPQQRPLGSSMDFSDVCGAGVSSSSPLQGMEYGSWNRFLISSPQFEVRVWAARLFASPPPPVAPPALQAAPPPL